MEGLSRSCIASVRPWLRPHHVLQSRCHTSALQQPLNCRHHIKRSFRIQSAAEEPGEEAADTQQPEIDDNPEEVFYEGSGAPAELALSLLMGITLVYLPITVASLGRHLWVKYKFTNKRIISVTNSPFFKGETQIDCKQIKEVRTAPRAFGMWGDMVVFLKDGTRLEILGLERCQEIKNYMLGCML